MKKIKIYSTPTCSFCKVLKNYLSSHEIEFKEIDISNNKTQQKEVLKKAGQLTVPIVEIGKDIIIGFDKEKIDKILNL
jgi:glutaredoxin 3